MYIQELLNYRMYLFRHIKRPYPSCRPLHLPKVPDNVCLQNSQPPIRKNIILIKFKSKQSLVVRFNTLAQSENLGLILPTKKSKISGTLTKFWFIRQFFKLCCYQISRIFPEIWPACSTKILGSIFCHKTWWVDKGLFFWLLFDRFVQ